MLVPWIVAAALGQPAPAPAPSPHAEAIDAIIEATAGARVIFLGEPDHGDGGAMAARAELTRRLHAEVGVRWVVFESSAFDAARADAAIERGGDPVEIVRDAVLDIWSSSTELEGLFRLMAASRGTGAPLHVAGMDSTPIGPTDRCLECEDIAARLARLEPAALDAGWRDVLDRLAAWYVGLDRTRRTPRPERLVEDLDALVARVIAGAPRIDAGLGPGAAAHIDRALRGWAVWIRTITPAPEQAGAVRAREEIGERDAMMAEQLLALLAELDRRGAGEERVVVWLHNVHAMRALPPITRADGAPLAGMTTPVAQLACAKLGRAAYCLALTAASGEVRASWETRPRAIDLPPDSLESRALAGRDGAASVFVPLARPATPGAGRGANPEGDGAADVLHGWMPAGLLSFMRVSADWSRAFDGVWVLRKTWPVRRAGSDLAE